MNLPDIKWEWRIGPQTALSLAQLIAIIVAIFGGFLKMQGDLEAQRESVTQLKVLVGTIQRSQSERADRLTRVETKVDLILPALSDIQHRIEKITPARVGP